MPDVATSETGVFMPAKSILKFWKIVNRHEATNR